MKPVLLGMNNPLSENPRHALFPYPPGCAGWNLMRLAGFEERQREWLEMFERRNILNGQEWDSERARIVGRELRAELRDRVVIVLGSEACAAVWPEALLARQYEWRRFQPAWRGERGPPGGWWARLPHPSGRCRDWNSDYHRAAVRVFFEEVEAALQRGDLGHGPPGLPATPQGDLFS